MKKIFFFMLEHLHCFQFSLGFDVQLKQFQVGQTFITVGHCLMTNAYFQPCSVSCGTISILKNNEKSNVTYHCFKHFNKENFKNEINNFNWEELLDLKIVILTILWTLSCIFLQKKYRRTQLLRLNLIKPLPYPVFHPSEVDKMRK